MSAPASGCFVFASSEPIQEPKVEGVRLFSGFVEILFPKFQVIVRLAVNFREERRKKR
jgi:hypothetical protein